MDTPRLNLVILEVADLQRSAALYRDAFGIDLHSGDNGGDDRCISGAHSEISWREGAYLHFALYAAKGVERSTGTQVGFTTTDIDVAHERAARAGAEVVHGPRPEPWGRTARYLDLDQNVVSLTEIPRAEA